MPVVEQRVAREIIAILKDYKTATATSLQALLSGGVYPWADISNGSSDNGTNRGRFPCATATPVSWNSSVPLSLSGATTPALPNWLTNGCGSNGWASVIYYAIGRDELYLDIFGGLLCTTCTFGYDQLRVYNAAGTSYVWVDAVLLTPGAATGSRTWTSGYFEDSENNDNNDRFITPTSTNYNRDRIFTIP
jgi:hypothetical protein